MHKHIIDHPDAACKAFKEGLGRGFDRIRHWVVSVICEDVIRKIFLVLRFFCLFLAEDASVLMELLDFAFTSLRNQTFYETLLFLDLSLQLVLLLLNAYGQLIQTLRLVLIQLFFV